MLVTKTLKRTPSQRPHIPLFLNKIRDQPKILLCHPQCPYNIFAVGTLNFRDLFLLAVATASCLQWHFATFAIYHLFRKLPRLR